MDKAIRPLIFKVENGEWEGSKSLNIVQGEPKGAYRCAGCLL